ELRTRGESVRGPQPDRPTRVPARGDLGHGGPLGEGRHLQRIRGTIVTGSAIVQRGETFPGFTLPDGFDFLLESYRGRRNLVVVFAADVMGASPVTALVQELLSRTEELTAEAAQALVIVTPPHVAAPRVPKGFPTLL